MPLRQLAAGRHALPARRHLLREGRADALGHGGRADHDRLVSGRAGGHRRRPARVSRKPRDELGAAGGRGGGRIRLDQDLSRRRRPASAAPVPARPPGSRCGASRTSGRWPWATLPIRWCRCTAIALAADLRSTNELWIGGKDEMRDSGIYCGPGLWFNRETGRIHIRLAHHQLAGPGRAGLSRRDRSAASCRWSSRSASATTCCGSAASSTCGSQDLVLRGATGSPMIHVYGSRERRARPPDGRIGGFPALLVNASQERPRDALGLSRAGRPVDLAGPHEVSRHGVVSDRPAEQPAGEREHRAGLVRVHRRPRLRVPAATSRTCSSTTTSSTTSTTTAWSAGRSCATHTLFISQNRIGRCLIPLTQHEIEKDESPLDHDPRPGVFVFRNVIDLRGGTYKGAAGRSPTRPARSCTRKGTWSATTAGRSGR